MVRQRWSVHSALLGLRVLRVALILSVPIAGVLIYRYRPVPPDLTERTIENAPPAVVAQVKHDLSWYAPIWERDLQQSPIPEAPVQAEMPAAPREPLPTLVATLISEEGRWAQLVGNDGRLRLKTIDDMLGGYRIAAIEPGRVQVMEGSNPHWLEVPRRMGK